MTMRYRGGIPRCQGQRVVFARDLLNALAEDLVAKLSMKTGLAHHASAEERTRSLDYGGVSAVRPLRHD